MNSAALVLSIVDARTEESHFVLVDSAALHWHSGKYPALCGHEVLAASLLAEPVRQCRACALRARRDERR